MVTQRMQNIVSFGKKRKVFKTHLYGKDKGSDGAGMHRDGRDRDVYT